MITELHSGKVNIYCYYIPHKCSCVVLFAHADWLAQR